MRPRAATKSAVTLLVLQLEGKTQCIPITQQFDFHLIKSSFNLQALFSDKSRAYYLEISQFDLHIQELCIACRETCLKTWV